jgi:hypothetical protein
MLISIAPQLIRDRRNLKRAIVDPFMELMDLGGILTIYRKIAE